MKFIGKTLTSMTAGLGLSALALFTSAHEAPASLDGLPLLEDVAADAIQISPHVPRMGTHWALESDLPAGPIYCVIEGRVVCLEYMFTTDELEAGTDWIGLAPGMETPPISHIDVEFKSEGIEPNPAPLYQVHIYFTAPALLEQH